METVKKVLLTGATGFIGRHAILPLLEKGYEVHAVSSRPHLPEKDVIWHEANLLNADALLPLVKAVRASHLLHFAWDVTPGKFWDAEINEAWLAASAALSRAFWEQGGERAVGIGTCAEYAWHAGDVICDERFTPIQPATKYGAAKHALHLAMAQHAALVDGSLAWARLFFQYGPGEPRQKFVASAIFALLKGEPFKVGFSSQTRDWLFVQDVADACVATLDSEFCGALNIASGSALANRQLVVEIAKITGNLDRVEFADGSPSVANPAGISPLVRRLQDVAKWHMRFGLQNGLERSVEYWRKKIDSL